MLFVLKRQNLLISKIEFEISCKFVVTATMTSTAAVKQQVTLKGSAQLVTEFFEYGIHSILYQRGIYPPESFTRKQEYGESDDLLKFL